MFEATICDTMREGAERLNEAETAQFGARLVNGAMSMACRHYNLTDEELERYIEHVFRRRKAS